MCTWTAASAINRTCVECLGTCDTKTRRKRNQHLPSPHVLLVTASAPRVALPVTEAAAGWLRGCKRLQQALTAGPACAEMTCLARGMRAATHGCGAWTCAASRRSRAACCTAAMWRTEAVRESCYPLHLKQVSTSLGESRGVLCSCEEVARRVLRRCHVED